MAIELFSFPTELIWRILSILAPRDICCCAIVGYFPLFHVTSKMNLLLVSMSDLQSLLEYDPEFCTHSIQARALCSGFH